METSDDSTVHSRICSCGLSLPLLYNSMLLLLGGGLLSLVCKHSSDPRWQPGHSAGLF